MVLFNSYIIMYQTRLHVLHKHGRLYMQHQYIEFKHILIKTSNAFMVMMLTLHRLMHFSRLLMKSVQTDSLRHMRNIEGHRPHFSAKTAEMQITSYLLRYLL